MGQDAIAYRREMRLQNIQDMHDMYMKYPTDEKLIANFCLKTGVSERMAKEYLKLLRNAGRIKDGQSRL